MEITVTIKGDHASPQLAKMLQDLGISLSGKTASPTREVTVKLPRKEEPAQTEQAPEKPAAVKEPGNAEETPKIDFEAIRELVSAKARAGLKKEIIALLKTYGADTVPDLKKEQFTDFYKELNDLS